MVIDNRGGAAGTLGVGLAVKAPNDGYTVVIGDLGSLIIAPLANPAVGYSYRDLTPIGLMATVSIVVSANPNSPDNSIGDFLARAKAQPGKLTYGTSGVGAPSHLAMEYLRSRTGVDILHVPYKGGAQAVAGLLGGQVDIVVDGAAMAQVKAGKLKALAVTGPRLPALPDVPGIGETIPDFSFTNWWGLLAPAGTAAGRREAPERGAQRHRGDAGRARQAARPRAHGARRFAAAFARPPATEAERVARIVKDARDQARVVVLRSRVFAASSASTCARHSGPLNFSVRRSTKARVLAGISRRPGNTAQRSIGVTRQSGSTWMSSPLSRWCSAK